MREYPESEKLVGQESVREFAEWLADKGYITVRTDVVVYHYLDIDPTKLECERKAMLEGLRKLNEEPVRVCDRQVPRCVEAGQHQPPCRCTLPEGHEGSHIGYQAGTRATKVPSMKARMK